VHEIIGRLNTNVAREEIQVERWIDLQLDAPALDG
jgi:hypothetical protein